MYLLIFANSFMLCIVMQVVNRVHCKSNASEAPPILAPKMFFIQNPSQARPARMHRPPPSLNVHWQAPCHRMHNFLIAYYFFWRFHFCEINIFEGANHDSNRHFKQKVLVVAKMLWALDYHIFDDEPWRSDTHPFRMSEIQSIRSMIFSYPTPVVVLMRSPRFRNYTIIQLNAANRHG